MNGQNGKGDTYRKLDNDKFRDNYDKIFSPPAPPDATDTTDQRHKDKEESASKGVRRTRTA